MKWLKEFKLFESKTYTIISKQEINFHTKDIINIKVDLSEYEFILEKTKKSETIHFEYEPDKFILNMNYKDGLINNVEFKEWILSLSSTDNNRTQPNVVEINNNKIELISIINEIDVKELKVNMIIEDKPVSFLVKLSLNLEIDNKINFYSNEDKEIMKKLGIDINDELIDLILKFI